MPKHAFKFPPEVVEAVKRRIHTAIEAVPPARFRQEANYTAALVGNLGAPEPVYQGAHGFVEFRATVFDDRGPNSAESRFGADLAITATVSDGKTTIEKVILIQAKLGYLVDLRPSEASSLRKQIAKMKHLVAAPKVMEIPEHSGRRFPAVISGNNFLAGLPYTAMDLPNYFAARVTTTLDGCTTPKIVTAVQDSTLSKLKVTAELRRNA